MAPSPVSQQGQRSCCAAGHRMVVPAFPSCCALPCPHGLCAPAGQAGKELESWNAAAQAGEGKAGTGRAPERGRQGDRRAAAGRGLVLVATAQGDLICGGSRAAAEHREGQQCLSWPERDPLSLAPPRLSCKTAAVPSELAQITSLTNSPGAQPLLTAAHTLQGWGTAGPHGTALWALPARLSKAWPGQVQLSRESWAGIAPVREAAPAGLLSSYGPAGQQGCSDRDTQGMADISWRGINSLSAGTGFKGSAPP